MVGFLGQLRIDVGTLLMVREPVMLVVYHYQVSIRVVVIGFVSVHSHFETSIGAILDYCSPNKHSVNFFPRRWTENGYSFWRPEENVFCLYDLLKSQGRLRLR